MTPEERNCFRRNAQVVQRVLQRPGITASKEFGESRDCPSCLLDVQGSERVPTKPERAGGAHILDVDSCVGESHVGAALLLQGRIRVGSSDLLGELRTTVLSLASALLTLVCD